MLTSFKDSIEIRSSLSEEPVGLEYGSGSQEPAVNHGRRPQSSSIFRQQRRKRKVAAGVLEI